MQKCGDEEKRSEEVREVIGLVGTFNDDPCFNW
jgi:hypothetical protein